MPFFCGERRRRHRVVADDAHAEAARLLRDEATDAAEPDDAHHLAVDLAAGEGGAIELALAQRPVGLRHVAGE